MAITDEGQPNAERGLNVDDGSNCLARPNSKRHRSNDAAGKQAGDNGTAVNRAASEPVCAAGQLSQAGGTPRTVADEHGEARGQVRHAINEPAAGKPCAGTVTFVGVLVAARHVQFVPRLLKTLETIGATHGCIVWDCEPQPDGFAPGFTHERCPIKSDEFIDRIAAMRNVVRDKFLVTHDPQLFFLDADVVPPASVLTLLHVNDELHISSLAYPMRNVNRVSILPHPGLMAGSGCVKGVGMGCTMINRECLEKLEFRPDERGEDTAFCTDLDDLLPWGVTVGADMHGDLLHYNDDGKARRFTVVGKLSGVMYVGRRESVSRTLAIGDTVEFLPWVAQPASDDMIRHVDEMNDPDWVCGMLPVLKFEEI